MRIELVKSWTDKKGKKFPVAQRMDVTPELFAEMGESAIQYKGNGFASRKKKKIKLSQLKK